MAIRFLLVCLFVAATIANAQIRDLDSQRLEVAKIVSHGAEATQTAAAIYVGSDANNAYFVTARHALLQFRGNDEILVDSVQLFLRAGEPVDAHVEKKSSFLEDLAVVYASISSRPQVRKPMTIAGVKAGVEIRIIGHPPPEQGWSVWPGTVTEEIGVADNPALFGTNVDLSLAPGYSGGAVFDMVGHFLGMHLSSTNVYSQNLKGAVIVDQLRVWGIPINNLAGQAAVQDVKPTTGCQYVLPNQRFSEVNIDATYHPEGFPKTKLSITLECENNDEGYKARFVGGLVFEGGTRDGQLFTFQTVSPGNNSLGKRAYFVSGGTLKVALTPSSSGFQTGEVTGQVGGTISVNSTDTSPSVGPDFDAA